MANMSGESQPPEVARDDRPSHVEDRSDQPAAPGDTDDGQFVPAELIPDRPSPYAFGIKALLAATAVAGVQFALMSYLGPFFGLMAGIGLCALAMIGLMIAAVALGLRPGNTLLDSLDRIAIRLVIGMVILFFGTIFAGGGQLIYMAIASARFQWKVQSDLGFTYQTRQLYDYPTGEPQSVLEVTSVTRGGPFDVAGVRQGDLVLLDGTPDDFLKDMDQQRGQAVDVTVANYAASSGRSSIDETTERTMTIQVPP